MTSADWNKKFGDQQLITLTNKERRYLGLSSILSEWDTIAYHSKTNLWYTRVTVFFEDNTIIKVISETKKVLNDGTTKYEDYVEYDTNLITADRKQLLPLTSRGKAKPLSASNITAVLPFGCGLSITFRAGEGTSLYLSNFVPTKTFLSVNGIQFHQFILTPISTLL